MISADIYYYYSNIYKCALPAAGEHTIPRHCQSSVAATFAEVIFQIPQVQEFNSMPPGSGGHHNRLVDFFTELLSQGHSQRIILVAE